MSALTKRQAELERNLAYFQTEEKLIREKIMYVKNLINCLQVEELNLKARVHMKKAEKAQNTQRSLASAQAEQEEKKVFEATNTEVLDLDVGNFSFIKDEFIEEEDD